MIDSNMFANLVQGSSSASTSFMMAEVSAIDGGKVYLTFNGETTQREKSYKRLSSYTPAVGDTVICAKLNNSYTILGKVV